MIHDALRRSVQLAIVDQDLRQCNRGDHQFEPARKTPDAQGP